MRRSRVPLISVAHTLEIPASVSAAIVAQVSARLERWMQIKPRTQLIVPGLEDLAIERGGRVWWFRGRRVAAEAAVRSLGGLLEALLVRPPQRHVPPGLLYVVSRATDERHLAPVQSVRDFAAAVARHAPARPLLAIDALVARYLAERSGAPAIASDSTISDVRRRRRAGGIPLGTIARDTGIPISLLRELEWGMYDNWLLPHAEPGVIAYADRAGLDPHSLLLVLAREQHQLQPSLPVHVRRIGLSDRARGIGLESRHRTAPYALAAGLLAMLAFATPSDPTRTGRLTPDTSVSARSAEVRTVSLETQQAAATPDEQQVMSTAEAESERAADAEPPRKRRKARALPANDEAVVGETGDDGRPAPGLMQTRLRSRTPPRTALARFAHAIAGDGTYRVEPFPRPADH